MIRCLVRGLAIPESCLYSMGTIPVYLYDWTEIEDQGARFEQLVAVHLKKACEFWVDAGLGDRQLHYLRNKEKREVDFLITSKDKPPVSVECKLRDTALDPSFLAFARHIGIKNRVQVVAEPGVWRMHSLEGVQTLVASADIVLAQLV